MSTENPEKKLSFLRRNRDLILFFLICASIFYWHVLTQPISPFLPRDEPHVPFERHHQFTTHFPFVTSYFLMVPDNYQPEKYVYPLVVMLHGASTHMYGGKVMARPEMRKHFPAFVLIPIAPYGAVWAMPNKNLFRPQALSLAIDAMESVIDQYSIDKSRVYITGASMGGAGTYGALIRYPGVFAAAAPTDGGWIPEQAGYLDNIPIWILHGTQDNVVPVIVARAMASVLKQARDNVLYTEYQGYGHGVWKPTYENPKFWYWLFSQKKK